MTRLPNADRLPSQTLMNLPIPAGRRSTWAWPDDVRNLASYLYDIYGPANYDSDPTIRDCVTRGYLTESRRIRDWSRDWRHFAIQNVKEHFRASSLLETNELRS